MMTLKKKIKSIVLIGWCAATLLIFCGTGVSAEPRFSPLYKQYENLSFEQLLGEFNSAVDFHDNLRAKITKNLTGKALEDFIKSDDWWCNNRQKELQIATNTWNDQALVELIVLENLRNGVLLEKIP
jgi:hypothetical protein